MNLIDPASGQTFECPQGWPSNTRRKAIALLEEKRAGKLAALIAEYPDVQELSKLDKDAQQKRRADDPALSVRSIEYANRANEIMTECTLATCRASLDTRTLTPERRALIESDVSAEFWQEQSVPDAADAGERFRACYARGRRADQVDQNVDGDEPATATVEDPARAEGAA